MVHDSAPEHYDAHPLWPYRGYTSDCNTQEYFNVQKENRWEFLLTMGWVQGSALIGLACLIFSPPKRNALWYLPLAIMSTAMAIITAHYHHDITHMCGNIQHHTNFGVAESENASGVKTVPHGVFMPLVCAQLLVTFIVSCCLHRSPDLSSGLSFVDYLKVYFPFQMFWLLWNMLVVHPYVHEHNKSVYPWPLSLIFQDYEGHVLCHHVSGYCLSSVPFTGILHNVLLFGHGKAYEFGIIERLTSGEAALSYIIDVVLVLLMTAYIVPVALTTKYFAGNRAEIKGGDIKKE